MVRDIIEQVKSLSVYSKERSEELGEVFTPIELIEDMCSTLPKTTWSDRTKTFFDPSAGKGNMPAVIVLRLMEGLKTQIPNEDVRYRHIMENQIYMAEYQRESAEDINNIFNPNNDIKLNLYVGDTLAMPDDFFDLSYEERHKKYPQHCLEPIAPPKKKAPVVDYRTETNDEFIKRILETARKLRKVA